MAAIAAVLLLCAVVLAVWSGASRARDPAPLPMLSEITGEQALGGWSLNDGWLFQRGDNAEWASPEFDDSGWERVSLPYRWYPGADSPKGDTFGWFRLRIHFDLDSEAERNQLSLLGLRMGSFFSAYELYAGGQKIGGSGRLPPHPDPAVDYDDESNFPIPLGAIPASGELVLALRVWGGSEAVVERWGVGPYKGEFRLGSYSDLLKAMVLRETPGMMVSIICAVFGLYHIYLFYRNRQLDSFLWFGLNAIAIGLYGVMINDWRYNLGFEFVTYKKLEFAAIYLVPPISLQMVWTMLDEQVGRWLRAYQLSFVALALLLVAIPGSDIHVSTLTWWQIWTLPAQALAGWLVIRKAREGHEEARTIALGGFVFIAACLHDIVTELTGLGSPGLIPWGFLALMLCMAVSLGNRFTATLNMLEREVAERTAELSEANRRLSETVRIDPLTGLLNRRGFVAEAESEIQRVFRTGRGFSVVLTDVDHFKSINDQYGHACGDHMLSRVASRLRDNVRDVDRVARWGGEEFIILLPETDSEGAAVLAEKLRQQIADNVFQFEGARLQVTMTFGVAAFRKGESLDSCIARADKALYRGKDEGRNKVMIGNYKGLSLVT